MLKLLVCFTAVLLAAVPGPAAALTFEVGATRDGTLIMVMGEIGPHEDFADLERLARQSGARGVTFDSPGGEIYQAMELGRLIRRLDLETMAWRSFECSSACAFAFLGGVRRYAEPGSIGVHRSCLGPEMVSVERAVEEIQQVTSDVMDYMLEMGVDPEFMQLALRYESRDMRYLSVSETEHFRVTTFGWFDRQDTRTGSARDAWWRYPEIAPQSARSP
jgi:hypothetical protein